MLSDKSFKSMKCKILVINHMFFIILCFWKLGKTCVSFDHSNNLLAGGKNGIIHTWDIQNRKIKNTYKVCRCFFIYMLIK